MPEDPDKIVNRFQDRIKVRPPKTGTGKPSLVNLPDAARRAIIRNALTAAMIDLYAPDGDKVIVFDINHLSRYFEAGVRITGIFDKDTGEGGYRVELVMPDDKAKPQPKPQTNETETETDQTDTQAP